MNAPKVFVPTPSKETRVTLSGVRTLDRRTGMRSGTATDAKDVDPRAFPELKTLPRIQTPTYHVPGTPLSCHGIGNDFYVFSYTGSTLFMSRLRGGSLLTVNMGLTSSFAPRELVQFNEYSDPQDPLSGSYRHIGILFPDKLRFDLDDATPVFEPISEDPLPALEHICVAHSRLFGTHRDRLYASAYNDPSDWDIDTAGDSGAANAWATTVQSNTRSTGDFTALTVYDGRLLSFKKAFCHTVNNTKTPFRVADLFEVGTPKAESVAEVCGKLLFASQDEIYVYDGNSVTAIGAPLAEGDFQGAIAAGVGGLYYLALPSSHKIYVYSPKTGGWSSIDEPGRMGVRCMAATDTQCYAVGADGYLYPIVSQLPSNAFSVTLSPIVDDGDNCRLARLSLVATMAQGARIEGTFTDTKGRATALLNYTAATAGTQKIISRAFTPADRGGSLTLSGSGETCIHEIVLVKTHTSL